MKEVKSLYFTSPGEVAIQVEDLPDYYSGEVVVKSHISAISAGTEMLIYRGQFPDGMPLDEEIFVFSGEFKYPQKYGYSVVGKVIKWGSMIRNSWKNELVFAFHPHESAFVEDPNTLQLLPESVSADDAVFLPNMETAVNLVMDGRPVVGENVLVIGQGIVGLLTTAILSQFPLAKLITIDPFALRRKTSIKLGADESLDPETRATPVMLETLFPDGIDLTFELSGNPAALNEAINHTGYDGRVVIGSWYGKKNEVVDLGDTFHRSRMRLISSQVSTIAPEFLGRWTKKRRFKTAWDMIRKIQPSRLITHEFSFKDAAKAYQLIDQKPEETLQVVLRYN